MTAKKFDPLADNRRWMLYAVFTILASWFGLWSVIQMPVTEPTKVLFYVVLFVAVTSTVTPAVAYLNARFGRLDEQRTYRARFVRESVWVGLCMVLIAWLQMQRVLSLLVALIVIAVFVLVETFLITRESPIDE